MKKILFICTSGKDRSPALVTYFSAVAEKHNYRCAGVNKYFCERKGTHYLTEEDVEWADLIVFAEYIHLEIFLRDFPMLKGKAVLESEMLHRLKDRMAHGSYPASGKFFNNKLTWVVLACGEYTQGAVGDDYLMKADLKLKEYLQ